MIVHIIRLIKRKRKKTCILRKIPIDAGEIEVVTTNPQLKPTRCTLKNEDGMEGEDDGAGKDSANCVKC